MILKELCDIVEGLVVTGEHRLGENVEYGFASDLMSDVLTVKSADFILITGLSNIQSVRTAEMSDIPCMLLCRGKQSTVEMAELARDNDMVLVETPFSMFKCVGLLYQAGLKALF